MTTIYGLERARSIATQLGSEGNGVASILFYGPKGCGKTLLVNQLAESWLATTRAIDSYRRGTNPDFFHIQPSGAGNQIQLRQISIPSAKKSDDPVPLLEYVRVPPLYSGHKVVWIEDIHRLNHDSANSLLKTLEEPPSYAKLVLTTSQISQIPATILSRCLVINCELPAIEDLRKGFPDLDEDLFVLAEGAPGTLGRIVANQDIYRDVIAYASQLAHAGPHSALILAEEFRKLSDRLDDAEKLGSRNANARTIELIGIALAKKHSGEVHAIRALTEAHRRILSNANSVLVLDSMVGKILLGHNVGTI